MRVRSQRTHLMGASNRQKESNAATVKDVIESSFLKTQNVYYQSGSSIGFAQQAGRSTGALTGVHT